MKAISLLQPWASLVILGIKQVETRSWFTGHRGRLAIHAGRKWSEVQASLCQTEPFASALCGPGRHYDGDPNVLGHVLPRGRILGVVELVDCLPTEKVGESPHGGNHYEREPSQAYGRLAVSKTERLLGNYGPGRWAFVLRDARPFAVPIPWRGGLSLFPVPEAALS